MKLRWVCAAAMSLMLFGGCSGDLEGNAPGSGLSEGAQTCGDGLCHVSELGACGEDCGAGAPVCGNGRCGATEDADTCPEDCAADADTPDEVNNETPDAPCEYPAGPANVQYNQVHPPLSWATAIDENGDVVGFSMRDFHCSPDFEQYNSVAFILGTGWCPACPDYLSHAAGLAETVREMGMLMVFVEAEDRSSVPSTSASAAAFLQRFIGDAPGLRIGDADTEPTARTLIQSPVVTAFPAGWIVRRSDMVVIAAQSQSQFILPFEQIAQDVNGDWGGASGGEANCGEEDEEIYEPNDEPLEAAVIEPGTFTGGICSTSYDYYKVELDGPWRFDLDFTHNLGDLDVYVWDVEANAPLAGEGGRPIGSESISDGESFEHSGPAVIAVLGFNLATAPYTATLTDLSE